MSDHTRAITVDKHVTPPPEGTALEKGRPPINVGVKGEGSMSLIWITTGVPNLTKVQYIIHIIIMGHVHVYTLCDPIQSVTHFTQD